MIQQQKMFWAHATQCFQKNIKVEFESQDFYLFIQNWKDVKTGKNCSTAGTKFMSLVHFQQVFLHSNMFYLNTQEPGQICETAK